MSINQTNKQTNKQTKKTACEFMSYSSYFVLFVAKATSSDFHANTIVEQFKRLLQRRETFFPIETKLEYASS